MKAPGLKPGLLYFTQAEGQRVDALISPYFCLDFFALNASLGFYLVSLTCNVFSLPPQVCLRNSSIPVNSS